jgi:hypothetical protein
VLFEFEREAAAAIPGATFLAMPDLGHVTQKQKKKVKNGVS